MKRHLKKSLTPKFWFDIMSHVWDKTHAKQYKFEPLKETEVQLQTDYILAQPSCGDVLKIKFTGKETDDHGTFYFGVYTREYRPGKFINGFTCIYDYEITKSIYKVIE